MTVSNRTPPKDLSKGLAVTETTLRKADDALKGAGPFMNDDRAAVLAKAQDVLVDARIENEFPIVYRIFTDVKQRLEGGEDIKFTPEQTKALLDIMQDLSFGENAVVKKLVELGVIPEAQADTFVKAHKDATNDAHGSMGRKGKWALANFANLGSTSAIGFGVAIAAGGPVGALGALAASTIWGMTAGQKIGGKIAEKAFVEGALLGMNMAQGKEVASEVMLLASRAVSGDVLGDKEPPSLLERLTREIAAGEMMVGARQRSGQAFSELELPFVEMGAKWLEGLAPIKEKLENKQLTEQQAAGEILQLRGQVLEEKGLESVAQAALAAYVKDPDGQLLLLLRQLASFADNLVKNLKDNDGQPDVTMQQTAAAMVMIYQSASQKVGALDERGMKLLATVAQGEKLSGKQLGELENTVAKKAHAELDAKEPQLKVTGGDAKKQAELAFEVLWKTVVPAFQEIEDAPVAKRMKATERKDGGFDVEGAFKGGFLGLFSEGSFAVVVNNIGEVMPESIKIDLGDDFMKDAAKNALKSYATLAGIDEKVKGVEIAKKGKAPDENYVLTARLGDQNAKVEITPMGMVAWDKIELS